MNRPGEIRATSHGFNALGYPQLVEAGATQQQIAERYGMSQQGVSQAVAVGSDKRLTSTASKLPASEYTLYLLTTLDDAAFFAAQSPA